MIRIDGYPIDIYVSQSHKLESEITDDQVESGSNTSDNILNKPRELELEGWVSDTPIGTIATDPSRTSVSGVVAHSRVAYLKLLDIRAARKPVTIETELEKLENMGLQSLTVPVDDKTGKGLHFTVSFKQLTITTNDRKLTVRTATPGCQGKVNGGNRQPLKGVNGQPVPAAFESVPRWCVSRDARKRASLVPSHGQPIFTSSRKQRLSTGSKQDPFAPVDLIDHYALGSRPVADGYIQRGSNHQDAYYAMYTSVDRFGRTSDNEDLWRGVDQGLQKQDPSDKLWKDDQGHAVTKVPPSPDRYPSATRGESPNDWINPPTQDGNF